MSLKEWKKKFYPVTAISFVRKNKKNLVALVDHAMLKWSGLSSKVLDEYGVHKTHHEIYDNYRENVLEINSYSCSLCEVFVKDRDDLEPFCTGCPLYESRGQTRCDTKTLAEDEHPYGAWIENLDNRPMLKALKKARKWAERNSQ